MIVVSADDFGSLEILCFGLNIIPFHRAPSCSDQNNRNNANSYWSITCKDGSAIAMELGCNNQFASGNEESDWTKHFPNLKSLSITFKNNKFILPTSLSTHPTLSNIDLSTDGIISIVGGDWRNMKNLQAVSLENAQLIPILPNSTETVYIEIKDGTPSSLSLDTTVFSSNLQSYYLDTNGKAITAPSLLPITFLQGATKLQQFTLYADGTPMDLRAFFNPTPTLTELTLGGLALVNNTCPTLQELGWSNIITLELDEVGLTGYFGDMFNLPAIRSLSLPNNPKAWTTLTDGIGQSNIQTLNVQNTNTSGTVPFNILSKSITQLDIRTTSLSGYLPPSFLCLPPEATDPNSKSNRKYLFDKVFLNYNATYIGKCAPVITSIVPYPVQVNSTITIFGESLAIVPGYYELKMNNSQGDVASLNCVASGTTSIACTNGQIQGAGMISLAIKVDPIAYAYANYTYQSPLITSATPCPTLGGYITLSGYDLMDPVGLNSDDTGITVAGKRCIHVRVLDPFRKITCYFPAGIISDVPFNFRVKGLGNTDQSVNFFYNRPLVSASRAVLPNTDTVFTIYGSDFWKDPSVVSVQIGASPNPIPCPVQSANHSIIVCAFPATPFQSGTLNIQVTVNGQVSPPNKLFQFVDENICPNACSNNGYCDVGVGYCTCSSNTFGADCSKEPIASDSAFETGTPMLTLSSSNNRTRLQAYLLSVIENGAETLAPANWGLVQDSNIATYNWSSKMNVVIRRNNATGFDLLGGSNNSFPAHSYTYQVQYQNTIYVSSSVQFRLAVKVVPDECSTNVNSKLAFPMPSNSTQDKYVHWSQLTQFDTEWMARYPQAGAINGQYGQVFSSVADASHGSYLELLVDVIPSTPKQDGIRTAVVSFDFAAYTAKNNRDPVTSCTSGGGSSSNGWKIAVGLVVGIVGLVVIGGLAYLSFRQHRKLEATKSLLDKKLAEINSNL
ncbi:hypothetical protein SAMD00019534_114160 [Acytostelium subglobosum LB1]|uniref:hypothetical protein n=1 Tax=Acytostelium subglobosum LB1 TaxID=1410327 RepID=UPI000644B43E|nr:hypothetical protein SAMD00019534_114160 [Acytostelium subglobosum LB1]GAM28240.1 hypothetical protein SAMD00019534_114160 [Acytostelium subglobosum LB1]|eukprot:XP_012748874.1 hypothetical protein SAMD00019534_114160 [Acytostelium subglobosum LB1]